MLIEFIESEISAKRERSIDYMRELCEVHLDEGEGEFRDRMVQYFTSKYARQDYLPADTEKGTKENCAIVKKYIDFNSEKRKEANNEFEKNIFQVAKQRCFW